MNKILIVDDDRMTLDFFDVMLSKLDFQVLLASDGEEALSLIKETPPDLILLDNILPNITGWEITRLLKKTEEYEDYRDIPIIMFSGIGGVEDKVEGFELGVEDYITKPFNFYELLARIRAVLRSRALSQQIVEREKRISLVESLNKSLIYFTEHLSTPVADVLEKARKLDPKGDKEVSSFAKEVEEECVNILAAIEGLEDEITTLEAQQNEIQNTELDMDELNKKFQEHFQLWLKRNEELNKES